MELIQSTTSGCSAGNGEEPIGSMGTDAALKVRSGSALSISGGKLTARGC